jgi:hypothetical protein
MTLDSNEIFMPSAQKLNSACFILDIETGDIEA